MAEYDTEELEDDSKDKKRLEKAEQCAERKTTKGRNKCVEPAAVKWGTCFMSNPATGSTVLLGMQTGYQVLQRLGRICCSSHCIAKDRRFGCLCCNTLLLCCFCSLLYLFVVLHVY